MIDVEEKRKNVADQVLIEGEQAVGHSYPTPTSIPDTLPPISSLTEEKDAKERRRLGRFQHCPLNGFHLMLEEPDKPSKKNF